MSDLSYIKSKIVTYSSKVGSKEILIHYRLFGNNIVLMENCYYEPEYIKLFINLVSTSIDDLLEKKFTTFVQKVTIEDWEQFLKENKDWEIVSKDIINETLDIKCPLDKALNNICIGLGLNK